MQTHGTAVGRFTSFIVDPLAPLTLNVANPSVNKPLGGLWDPGMGSPSGMLLQYVTSNRIDAASLTCKGGLITITDTYFAAEDFQTVITEGLFIEVWGDTETAEIYGGQTVANGKHVKIPLTPSSALQIQLDSPTGNDAITIDKFFVEWWY